MTTHSASSRARRIANEEIVAHSLGEVRTFVDELRHGTRKYRTVASLGGQIAEAYRGRCVLELLQNGHDALPDPPSGDPGMVTFALATEPSPVLLVANSGRGFERKDFKGLCQLGQSPKDPNKSVGNKGLGFRSVLEVASAPEIWSTAASEGEPEFVFGFDPAFRGNIAAALENLSATGLTARSPFDANVPLVDWTEGQLGDYHHRLSREGIDAPREADTFLSPYDIPLPLDRRRGAVDELIRDGHVTVVCLPLDGGRTGDGHDAVASIKEQLEDLLDVATTLFLPRLRTLIVDIDGRERVIERYVDMENALGDGGRTRCQGVVITRVGPVKEEDATVRYRVWTRTLGGDGDAAGAVRIRNAVRHLPNKWPDVDRVEVGIAVQEGDQAAKGRFVIFLPTEMRTGTGAHINAPFFGSLNRRRVAFNDEYNRLLLEWVLDLSLDAIDELVMGQPDQLRGQAVIDVLSSNDDVGELGQSMLDLVFERSAVREVKLKDCALLLCDGGWTVASKARAMPQVDNGLAVAAEDWRRAAGFAVVSRALDGRADAVRILAEQLGGSLSPTGVEWSRTLQGAAQRVQAGEIDVTWDGFLTSAIQVLPWNLSRDPAPGVEDVLATAEFLPDQDGRLRSASDSVRVFFRPVVGLDDAAELVDTVPDSLKNRIAFIHRDVLTHDDGPQRRRTAVHKFLDDRFATGFGREEIVRDVVLGALPPLPVPFNTGESELCAELFRWTRSLVGEDPADTLIALLGRLPVPCHGGWYPARRAVFGPGWPGRSGEDLWVLSEELGGAKAERLRRAAVLDPEDPRWGTDVNDSGNWLKRIGVADGLRLTSVGDMRFGMHLPGYELPRKRPTGVDQSAWDGWREAVHGEAMPPYVGGFTYSLERVFDLPELHSFKDLTLRGRRAFSQLLVVSLASWPDRWRQVRLRKVVGEPHAWWITSPLKHWLGRLPWLSDGEAAPRPLSERWLLPTSLLRGQQERFRHLRPISLDLSRRLEADPELLDALKSLGLNAYPVDEELVGPILLDALADAWSNGRVPPGRFDAFLGQIRHAWRHLNENKGLPNAFLFRTARRSLKARVADDVGAGYVPDDAENGRALRESGTPVLEMEVRDANRLAQVLVEATGIGRASDLVERVLIDGTEWVGTSEDTQALAETRYGWLPAPLLAVAAHGGPSPTGSATQGWKAAYDRLQAASVLQCEAIVVELVAGERLIGRSEPEARWLTGDVLAVTHGTGNAYERLAPALQAMLGRQDLLKDLRLVLGELGGFDAPSLQGVEAALERAEIDGLAYADVRNHWAGSTGLVASRVRPVAELLGVSMDGFQSAAANVDALAVWLAERVREWETPNLIATARRSRSDYGMGFAAWTALGERAQLPAWNAVLASLGDEYEPVQNKLVGEQVAAHLDAMRSLLQALARHVAIELNEPELFRQLEAATVDFKVPDGWSERWWEVPFSAVIEALHHRHQRTVATGHIDVLLGVASVDELRDALKERDIETELDAYETARVNTDRFKRVVLDVHDLYGGWVEARSPGSQPPTEPAIPDLGAEAYLCRLTDAELWRRAVAALEDRSFAAACGDSSDPAKVRKRLGLDEETITKKRHERAAREEKAARKRREIRIAGVVFEIGAIDYPGLLRDHIATLAEPIGPKASKDDFARLGTPSHRSGTSGGGGWSGNATSSRPSSDETDLIGVVGEIQAYRYLRKEFGLRAVRADAWVSRSRLLVLPLVDAERDETSDGHGFDFRFRHSGIKWHVEVKATKGDETTFDLGISEIEAATSIARRRSPKWRWRILRIRRVLSRDPEFDWLPNPFEDGFRQHYRLHQGGMIVSYRRKG